MIAPVLSPNQTSDGDHFDLVSRITRQILSLVPRFYSTQCKGVLSSLARLWPIACIRIATQHARLLSGTNYNLVQLETPTSYMTSAALLKLGCAVGLVRVLESVARAPILVVLNYHRIGDPAQCQYDPGTYSATAEQFDTQIEYLQKRFGIVCLSEALHILAHGTKRPAILITFDDGYSDNYKLAFPILKSHSATGTFFLPTAFVGTNRLPWWDAIAYMLQNSKRTIVRMSYPEPLQVDVSVFRAALRTILRSYKSPMTTDATRFLTELAAATGVEIPRTADEPLFMSWNDARQMAQAGMDLGSHTHSHDILARLSADQQRWELKHSRELVRQHTGVDVTTLAFPVGNQTTFSLETYDALTHCGYRAAFSFYGGINIPKHTKLYDIRRNAVTLDYSVPVIRWRVSRMVAGAGWPVLKANL